MFVVYQILALFAAWSLDEEENVTTPPPLFFELIQVDLLGVLLLRRSHVAVYSEKREDKGVIHPEQKKQNEDVMRRSL